MSNPTKKRKRQGDMIWYWLILAIKKAIWLFRIPKPDDLAYINRNAKCPVCGWERGHLRAVHMQTGLQVQNRPPEKKLKCQQTCDNCGARIFHEPVAKTARAENILPAVARTELEAREDRANVMQSDRAN